MAAIETTILSYVGIDITANDIESLSQREYINDKIINFYLKYLSMELLGAEQSEKVHIFDSYFMDVVKLMDNNRLRRWLRRVNIFDMDYLMIPYNYDEHWLLIVICFPRNLIIKDTDRPRNQRPRILLMDSLGNFLRSAKKKLVKALYAFIQFACCEQGIQIDSLTPLSKYLPLDEHSFKQQKNLYDCGLCLMENAELFLVQSFPLNNAIDDEKCFWLSKSRRKRADLKKHIYNLATNEP